MEIATVIFKHLNSKVLWCLVTFDLGTSIGLGGDGTTVGREPSTSSLEKA